MGFPRTTWALPRRAETTATKVLEYSQDSSLEADSVATRRRGRRRAKQLTHESCEFEAHFRSRQSNALFSYELRTASNVPLARRRELVGPEPDAFGLGFHRLVVIVGGLVSSGGVWLALKVCYVGLRALLLIALVPAVG